ncbi:tetratricopeptide repeat protein [Ulvibacter litoralis]|uniref:Uncharacterized protein n=1 Tax=Ulvibacter litoralis TaxID=227084 RepID=A0A1G7D2U6_9FLAO|nr:tetratricopeptide repeat protein [Ulvibacter litoralis]GHC45244.1 hypothetical protein GCM10008083_04970 [Ulvibacter litoralis]SDE45360.1 hypothetical protein SAMN05421855_101704 [Ulvibacter litoralis]
MKQTNEYLIAAYLRDEFSTPEEEMEFKKRLAQDSEFQEELAFEQELFDTFQEDRWASTSEASSSKVNTYEKWFEEEPIEDWKETISSAIKPTSETPVIPIKSRKNWMAVAAMILVLLIPIYFLMNRDVTPEELYANHVNLKDLPTFVVRGDSDAQNLNKLAQQQFEARDFVKSTETLKRFITQHPDPDAVLYIYLGLSQLELNQFEDAENTFVKLQQLDAIESERAYWYLALLQTKKGAYSEAKKKLNEVISNQYFGYQEAKNLLEEIPE